MKRILLVGATGLIGATVLRRLSATFDIVTLGRRPASDIPGDLSQPATLASLRFEGCDAVVHCAGVTDEDFKVRPVEAFVQSTLGMDALVQAAKATGITRFLYISTSHVYGSQAGVINEESPVNPLSDYALAHFAAEQILRRNAEDFHSCWVLRPNAVFGLPLHLDKFHRWSLIPYSFPLEAAYNGSIVLRSSGEQKRNLVGTEDLAECIERLLTSQTAVGEDKRRFEVINPIGRESLSVYSFALRCAEIYQVLTGKPCTVKRPSTNSSIPEAGFIYQSKRRDRESTSDLTTFLTGFMHRILEDLRNGKRYGV
jgi:UDP-glucose 4-epimerase